MGHKGFINTTILLIIWAIVSVILFGLIYWWFFSPPPSQKETASTPTTKPLASITPRIGETFSGQIGKDKVTLQDEYIVYYSLPDGMSYEEGDGSYSGYIIDADEFPLIGFVRSSPQDTPSNPKGAVMIDEVAFDLYYKTEVICGVELRPRNPKYSEVEPLKNLLQFKIITWCGDYSEQDPTFKKVISSIWFSPKLKQFLKGETEGPILKRYAAPQQ